MRLTNEVETFTLELSSPITEEEWDMITDVDFDKTEHVYFHTKHGKDVHFYKQRTGRLIVDEDGNITCSVCGSHERWGNYCMNCGAKMEVEK